MQTVYWGILFLCPTHYIKSPVNIINGSHYPWVYHMHWILHSSEPSIKVGLITQTLVQVIVAAPPKLACQAVGIFLGGCIRLSFKTVHWFQRKLESEKGGTCPVCTKKAKIALSLRWTAGISSKQLRACHSRTFPDSAPAPLSCSLNGPNQ